MCSPVSRVTRLAAATELDRSSCCLAEFWARYARYLEKRDLAGAQSVVQRATLVHAKRTADSHIFAAHFEERHGRIEEARSSLAHITTTLNPSLLNAVFAHASFEKRQGNKQAAQEVGHMAGDNMVAACSRRLPQDASISFALATTTCNALLIWVAADAFLQLANAHELAAQGEGHVACHCMVTAFAC